MTFVIGPNPLAARRSRLSSLLLIGTAASLCSSVARAETLMDAVAAAYANNPTLVAQRYRQKSTNESYVQTRGQYGPTLSVSAAAQYQYGELQGRRFLSDKAGDVSLSLRQPVYTGGRLRGALAEARANVRGSEELLRQVEGEVVRQVVEVYAAVMRDQQRLEVARQNVVVLREQLKQSRAKRRVRDVTITDVAQSDSRLAAGEVQLATAEAQLEISRGEYLRIIGHAPVDLKPLPDLGDLPSSIDEAFDIADQENPELGVARFSEAASRANIAEQRGNQRPTASISAQADKAGPLSPFDRDKYRTDVTAVVTITQPIFQGGILRSRVRQAQALNNADQALLDGARRQIIQDVTIAWSQLSAYRAGITSGIRQVEAAQIAFAGTQREERYGLRSTIEVLNTEQELASAQINLLQSRYNEYVARAELLRSMGRLDARAVNSAIPARDAEAEFKKVRFRHMMPTEPAAMLLDRIGSADPASKRKPDLRGLNQPKPTGIKPLPPQPSPQQASEQLVPIMESPLVPADKLPAIVGTYDTPPPDSAPPR